MAETLDRDALWAAQTPQAFRLAALQAAQRAAAEAGVLEPATDEAWLIERAGGTVLLEETGSANFKVTTAADLKAAAALIASARQALRDQARSRISAVTMKTKTTCPIPSAVPRLAAPSASPASGREGEGSEGDADVGQSRDPTRVAADRC